MTSRQPGSTRGITGHVEAPGGAGAGAAGAGGAGGETAGQDWMRWVPVALLIVLGLAGLRGAVGTPRWNGPLHPTSCPRPSSTGS